MEFAKIDNTEFVEKLSRLADRLGVERIDGKPGNGQFRFTIGTSPGPQYDMLDMMHAMLDRIDKATN